MGHDRAALAHRARQIDPLLLGLRVRAARLESGLTQAEVAGQAFSTAYLSRIEAGTRRPTMDLLEKIASAVDISVDALLFRDVYEAQTELRARLAHAEYRLSEGDAEEALRLAVVVERDAEALQVLDVTDHAQYVRSAALIELGSAELAIPLLEYLVLSERMGSKSVRVHAALCRCYSSVGRLDEAVAAAGRGQELVEEHRLQRLPEALELAVAYSDVQLRLGQREKAVGIWRAAVAAAQSFRFDEVRRELIEASQRETDAGAFAQAWRHAEHATAMRELEASQANLETLAARIRRAE